MRAATVQPYQDEAEGRLFAELYPQLRRFAAVVGPAEVDPDDLLQDAVARTLRRHRLTELDAPGAYLRRVIVHLASNHRRRLAVRRQALARLAGGTEAPVDTYPSDLAELARLTPTERAVFYLAEVEGYRHAEIAALLGCSQAAARKRAMRARRHLYAALSQEVADV